MEHALNALERNKPESNDIFRQVLHSPDCRYDSVRLAISAISEAASKRQVLSRPAHISRYIKLALSILERQAHVEHLNCEEWKALVEFLIIAYDEFKETLRGIELVKSASEVFYGLSILMKAKQSCSSDVFPDILAACTNFITEHEQKETSCHSHIMSCVRALLELGFSQSCELGERLLGLGKVRNQTLAYEMFAFACLKPQELSTLYEIGPRIIEAHEIEFLPSNEFSFPGLRPSGEADLTKFVEAKALCLASRASKAYKTEPSASKKRKIEFEGNVGLNYMTLAFAGSTGEGHQDLVEWLRKENQGMRNNSMNGSSKKVGPNQSFSLVSKRRTSSEDSAATFWAFVILAQSVPAMSKSQQLLVWDLCVDHIRDEKSTSGACYCLSQLVGSLLIPVNADSQVLNKVRWLINTMANSSHPIMSSGSLILYNLLFGIKVLDDDFQKLKSSQLKTWLQSRIRDGSPRLITHLLAYECPPAYFQSQVADDLKILASFARTKKLQEILEGPFDALRISADVPASMNGSSPLVTSVPSIEMSGIKNSLWGLAISAKAGFNITLPLESQGDAFAEEDLQAIVWFANLANYLQWGRGICEIALSLARWDAPAADFPSVARAIALLQLPGPVVSAVISGYNSPYLDFHENSSSELRKLEPFLQSYSFQRSPWILCNLARLLQHEALRNTSESAQLSKFLIKTSSSQSLFAPLRSAVCSYSGEASTEVFVQLAKSTADNLLLEVLVYAPFDADRRLMLSQNAQAVLSAFRESRTRVAAAILLAKREIMSIAQLLIMLAYEEPEQIPSLSHVSRLLHLGEFSEKLFSVAGASLYFAEYGSKENVPSTVLTQLGAPIALIERFECFMRPFRQLALTLSDGQLGGIVEQVMRDVSYHGSDLERERCIKETFTFIRAHRSHISDFLLRLFFQSSCSLVVDGASGASGFSPAARLAMASLAQSELRETRSTNLIGNIASCLYYTGLDKIALALISRQSQDNSELGSLLRLLSSLDADSLPNMLESLHKFELTEECSYEIFYMVIRSAISVVESVGTEKCFESCANLACPVVRCLTAWTNYLILPFSAPWLAFLGKLIAKSRMHVGKVEMERSTFNFDNEINTAVSGIEVFYDMLLQIYRQLPCHKRWKLHLYFQRDPNISIRVHEELPDDIFGEVNWEAEAKFRPVLEKNDEEFNFICLNAEHISNGAAALLGLQPLGANIFTELPELVRGLLPSMVAAYYSQPRVPSSIDSSKNSTAGGEELADKLKEGLEKPELQSLSLEIQEQCYKRCRKTPNSFQKVVIACVEQIKRTSNTRFVNFGTLSAELIWNESPNHSVEGVVLDALRYFYSKLPDKAFKYALPDCQTWNAEPYGIKVGEELSRWQQLEIDMVRTEAQTFSNDHTLGSSLQKAGLWRLANRVTTELGYYDLERAWWLQEWDRIHISRSELSSEYFENQEFGALIGFFNKSLSKDDTIAELLRVDPGMLAAFEDITQRNGPMTLSGGSSYLQVARRGREIIFKTDGDVIGLANELKSYCEQCRAVGDVNRAVEYAIKIGDLAKSSLESPEIVDSATASELKALSCIETAKTEWELGRLSTAIAKMKQVVSDFNFTRPDVSKISSAERQSAYIGDDSDKKYPQIIDIGELYCTIGTWSRAARNEPDSIVLDSYFAKAEQTVDRSNVERLYHEFARFCDDACHDKTLEVAIQDSERVKANEQHQVEYLSKAIQSGNTDKAFQHKYRLSLRMLKAESEDLANLKQRKLDLTLRCVRNYLLSMKAGDSYEEDMGRFIALWFSLCGQNEVNVLVKDQLFGTAARRNRAGGSSHHPGSKHDENGSSRTTLVRKMLPWMNQLTSRLMPDNSEFQVTLSQVIGQAVEDHPYHSLWQLINILKTKDSANHGAAERKEAVKSVINGSMGKKSKLFLRLSEFADRMVELGSATLPEGSPKQVPLATFGTKLNQWWNRKLPSLQVPLPTVSIEARADARYDGVAYIAAIEPSADIAGGISAPKIVSVVSSDGELHKMVLKGSDKDDMRQDAIMQQVFGIASDLLSHSSKASLSQTRQSRKLRVRTYNVVPLGGVAGAIEFVRNTRSLQEILEPLHTLHGGRQEYSLRKARHTMHAKRDHNRTVRIATFEDVMQHTPPQMRRFWPKRFRDPQDWLESKTAWCRSTAVTSMLGYVVGLGDRHCSNLLLDTRTGEVVHIDLGIAFDQGKQLYVPETVPFRLTRDMIDGMGVHGVDGVFMSVAESTLRVLRDQRDRIMTVLEVLKHDALYTWRLPPLKLNRVQISNDGEAVGLIADVPRAERGQAEHALRGVRQKLTASLSCEATVRDLVEQATNTENLALIFSGWSPFY